MKPTTNPELITEITRHVYSSSPAPGARATARFEPRRLAWSLGLLLPLALQPAIAADSGASATTPAPKLGSLTKPAWLTDLSLGVKEGYDDNVFMAGAKKSDYPAGTDLSKIHSGIAAAVIDKTSFVTTVSPKIGVNFAPLLGDQKFFKALALAYSPDFVVYQDASSESYNAHRFAASVKAGNDTVALSLENSWNLIDGSKFGPLFPGSFNSAYGTAALRERRDQDQDRSTASVQYNIDKFFVRPTGSLLYYDLHTEQLTKAQAGGLAGYQNYADRYDLNGGADLGYKVMPKFAATVGYRYGHQFQQKYSHAIDALGLSSSSDYQRVLFGVEGSPVKWLEAKLQIGPDFRTYGDSAPVENRHYTTYYGEASLTANVTSSDSIVFKYKQYQWVSSTGKVPYFDSTYDLLYRRSWCSHFITEIGARFLESDYTSGLDTTKLPGTKTENPRNDSQTTFVVGLTYVFNAHASATVSYQADLGRNLQNGIVNESTREFDHNLVSLGANFKF